MSATSVRFASPKEVIYRRFRQPDPISRRDILVTSVNVGNIVPGVFTQDPTNRGKTGDGMADFLLGLSSSMQIGNQNGETGLTHNYSAFFQDDWRVTGRLTLNLGIRWDDFGPPSFPDSNVSRYEIFPGANFNQFVFPNNGGDCGCEQDLNNFAPRVGFALQVTPRTVLR